MNRANTTIAIADDHKLLRKGLAEHIRTLDIYDIIFEADNGSDLLEQISKFCPPEIALIDINMPVMDGYETAIQISRIYPSVKILALSMYDNEESIIRMLRCGAKGYILKDIEPSEFKLALDSIRDKGFYYSELVTGKLIHAINNLTEEEQSLMNVLNLSGREVEFLKYACSEMTYKEISDKMNLSVRTIDGYRDSLFEKLGVKSRVGLVMFAIRKKIFLLD